LHTDGLLRRPPVKRRNVATPADDPLRAAMEEWEWRKLRELKDAALERFCGSALAEIGKMLSAPGGSNHERFLSLYRLIHEQNDQIADAFDDLRRSTAERQLAAMRRLGLVTDQELAAFSDKTRSTIEFLADLSRR
jgi:DNA-binding transcriptional ArsR family regulator